MSNVNTKVAGDSGGFKYIRIPKDLFDRIKAGEIDGYSVEVKLPGTSWQSAKLLSGKKLVSYTQAKILLGEKVNQPESKAKKPPKKTKTAKKKKSETVAAAEKQEEESVADEKVLWSVVQNEIYSDGSIKVRRMSGHEFQEVPEIKKPSTRDGSWERKFAFDYSREAPGRPDALIGLPGAGQSPGYDLQGVIIFMEFPQIPSGDPNNTYTKGDPSRVRAASR